MLRQLLAILLLVAFVLAGWAICGDVKAQTEKDTTTDPAEEAYQKAIEKRNETEAIEERLAITKGFLDEFPESKRTANSLSAIFYYQGQELGDMPGAIEYVESIRSKVTDPDIARDVDKEMVSMYGNAGMTDKMLELADRLAAAGVLNFNDHWSIIEIAVEKEDWKLVRSYCEKAKGMANAETFRSDYPDREFSDEEIAKAANNRMGMLLVKDGWARANLGETTEALADFAKANGLVRRSYFDVPENDLNLHWAKTLMMNADYQAAIKRFATEALILQNEDALAGLKEAYVGINGEETGFEAYAAELHRSIAKTIDEFELPDYDGKRHSFSDLRGDVTLVAFWFPT